MMICHWKSCLTVNREKRIDKLRKQVYTMSKEYKLSPEQVKSIEQAAPQADRIELLPCKEGGFKITAIQRKEVK